MPELKPTRATAEVRPDGSVFAICGLQPELATPPLDYAPCLILPAWRPIAECPEEWKDGRWVWLYRPHGKRWISARWDKRREWWYGEPGVYMVTHAMLPSPDPEEHA